MAAAEKAQVLFRMKMMPAMMTTTAAMVMIALRSIV
jgi:hypothetical protein